MTSPHCTCHLIDYPANPPWDRCIACNAALDAADAARESGRNIANLTAAVEKLAEALAGTLDQRPYSPPSAPASPRSLPAGPPQAPDGSVAANIPEGLRPRSGPSRGW